MQKLFFLITAWMILLSSAFPAHADTGTYAAEVNIDITAESAAAAREKGMNQAYRSAFLAIAGKITTDDGIKKLSQLTDPQLVNFIQETSVVSEKASDVRYIAKLRITINEALLKTYMREQGIPFVVNSAANILVIPVFREFAGDAPLLWESGNIWRKAWESATIANTTNTYVSLPSDGTNYTALDAEKALRLDGEALDKIAAHMGTRNIYVLDAVYNGIEGIKITVLPYNGGNPNTIFVSGDRSPDLFAKAIPEVTAYIDSGLRRQNIAMSSRPSEMIVLYNYSTLGDWVKTEKDVKSIASVNGINIDAIGQNKVQFRITYVGSPDDLAAALRMKALSLKNFDTFYTLERISN